MFTKGAYIPMSRKAPPCIPISSRILIKNKDLYAAIAVRKEEEARVVLFDGAWLQLNALVR
jgi:hypothetical protein